MGIFFAPQGAKKYRENQTSFSSKCVASIDFLSSGLIYRLRNQVLHVGGYSATSDLEGNDGNLKQNLKLSISAEMGVGTTHTLLIPQMPWTVQKQLNLI